MSTTDWLGQHKGVIVCCDFCDTLAESEAHIARMRAAYRGDLTPPSGWTILPFGHEVPAVHREYIHGVGWARPRRCQSTMTPIYAKPLGLVLAYAVPIPQ